MKSKSMRRRRRSIACARTCDVGGGGSGGPVFGYHADSQGDIDGATIHGYIVGVAAPTSTHNQYVYYGQEYNLISAYNATLATG